MLLHSFFSVFSFTAQHTPFFFCPPFFLDPGKWRLWLPVLQWKIHKSLGRGLKVRNPHGTCLNLLWLFYSKKTKKARKWFCKVCNFFLTCPNTDETANVHVMLESDGPVEEQRYLWWLYAHNACCRIKKRHLRFRRANLDGTQLNITKWKTVVQSEHDLKHRDGKNVHNKKRLNKFNHIIPLYMERACYRKSNSPDTERKLVASYSLLYFLLSIYNN